MAGYKVITSAVRAEAGKWDELAGQVTPVRAAVAEFTLSPLSFFVLDAVTLAIFPLKLPTPPEELQRSYEVVRSFIEKLLSGAETEFAEIADALTAIANTYDEQEKVVELDLNEVY